MISTTKMEQIYVLAFCTNVHCDQSTEPKDMVSYECGYFYYCPLFGTLTCTNVAATTRAKTQKSQANDCKQSGQPSTILTPGVEVTKKQRPQARLQILQS